MEKYYKVIYGTADNIEAHVSIEISNGFLPAGGITVHGSLFAQGLPDNWTTITAVQPVDHTITKE